MGEIEIVFLVLCLTFTLFALAAVAQFFFGLPDRRRLAARRLAPTVWAPLERRDSEVQAALEKLRARRRRRASR